MPEIAEAALTAAHLAVEDVLVDFRDERISVLGPANGFVIRERDGRPSGVMRLGTRDGLRIAIKAYLAALDGDIDPRIPTPRPDPASYQFVPIWEDLTCPPTANPQGAT
jgi:hypothetical protein